MFCPACGKEISDSAKFCPGCGSAMAPAPAPAPAPVAPAPAPAPQTDDAALVAAITAAVAAYLDQSPTSFRVVSFKRTGKKK